MLTSTLAKKYLEKPKLISNLNLLYLLVLGLGIHWIEVLLQVRKVLNLVSLVLSPPLFSINRYKRLR